MKNVFLFSAVLIGVVLLERTPAQAIPYFAHEYDISCQKCHTAIPRLTAFGKAFLDHGYAMPGGTPQRAFPISTRVNLAYSSEPDPGGLPKAIVDEVEVILAGKPSARTNYFIEQYFVDGGRPGAIRDAWLAYRLTTDGAKIPVYLQGGSFTLPLPIDPETFRETNQHYTIFDQVVGTNPFNFFEPKIGLQGRVGSNERGISVHLAAMQGHDEQSGIASMGTDFMSDVQTVLGPITLSLYRYDGSRPDNGFVDRFRRQGYALTYSSTRWTVENVLQIGHDASFDGAGMPAMSSGGFSQVRYEFSRRIFGVLRYEGTNDPGNFTRDLVPMLGFRPSQNARFTIEDVIGHTPQTKNTLNTQYTVAY
jgi:hypothetical protein